MLVALIVVSLAALILLAALVSFTSRPSPGSQRERLLERDVLRLQRELDHAHAKLMHLVEKPWELPPIVTQTASLENRDFYDDDEPEEHRVLTHDELTDDDLLLEPEVVSL